MAIDLNGLSAQQLVHGALKKPTQAAQQETTFQHWKKAFDQALAENSVCKPIAPDSRDFGTVVKDSMATVTANATPKPASPVFPAVKSSEQGPTVAASAVTDTVPGRWNQSGVPQQPGNIQAYIGSTPIQNQLLAKGVIDAETIQMPSAQYLQAANRRPDAELSALNLFISIDQDKARIWLRDNRGDTVATDKMLNRATQGLRAKNIELSSLVINGVSHFSDLNK